MNLLIKMSLCDLPSVEQLLQTRHATQLIAIYGRPLTLQVTRGVLDELRIQYSSEVNSFLPDLDGIVSLVDHQLHELTSPSLVSVINASGVILHTNLGRAPLSDSAIQIMDAVSKGYSNLEFELETGKRGSRLIHVESLLKLMTGAEAAYVANNNAAGLLLVLSALARKKRVIISRSQLVEVGGGFRIPDVLKQSGAKLVEVGATNRVNLDDYKEALRDSPSLILVAHHSNYKIIGFSGEPEKKEIANLAHASGVLFVDDLGSGAFLATERFGLAHEPTVQEALLFGADLVCFSGDKLLGGPQAGIIVGKAELMEKIKKHPLARAVRADKLCLAALAATLLHYLRDEAEQKIPIWRMISNTPEQLKTRVVSWSSKLGQGDIMSSESTIGGGSLPGETMPTWTLALSVKDPEEFMHALRHEHPPIIARTFKDRILLDPRTVLPEQDEALLTGLANVIAFQK